jgi:hypothetical protein
MSRRGWETLRFACVLLSAGWLSGCASPPKPQGQAMNAYSATPAGRDMYRINYQGEANVTDERIRDFALAYASHLADNEGYGYFAVIDEARSTGGEIYYFEDEAALEKKADPKTLMVQYFHHRPKRIMVFRAGHTANVIYEKYGLNRRPQA